MGSMSAQRRHPRSHSGDIGPMLCKVQCANNDVSCLCANNDVSCLVDLGQEKLTNPERSAMRGTHSFPTHAGSSDLAHLEMSPKYRKLISSSAPCSSLSPFTAGTDFKRQNLTSALKEIQIYNGRRPIT